MSDFFSKNCWYAIGGSLAFEAGAVSPAQLFGKERVVWRGGDGISHVWQNQCIHRGMRLQYGFVDQDRLSCRYHGWRFGGDGKCAYIPAHPNMTPPDDFFVPAHPSAESAGLVWTTTGDPGCTPPNLSGFANLTFCRSITIDIKPSIVGKALSDLPSSRPIAAGISAIEISSDASLVVAVQPVNNEKTQLHILTTSVEAASAKVRQLGSSWARQFRWQVENYVAADSAPQAAT